jgi:dTDP-4-dehydrorhamnose reductase
MAKILVLGDGKLATEIVKQTRWNYVSRKKDNVDARDLSTYAAHVMKYDTVVNCIAYTGTYDPQRQEAWDINYRFVAELADFCEAFHKKLVHISTDFVYANSKEFASEEDIPSHALNWYSYSKLLGDAHVQMRNSDYLLIRTSFKPKPFPHDKAFYDQVGNFDYTDKIAELIIKLIKNKASGVYNVGTETKDVYELAKQTKPDVVGIAVVSAINTSVPYDVTMDLSKMKAFLKNEL